MHRQHHIAYGYLLAGMLALSACTGVPRSSGTAVHAAKPPADYVYLASGDTRTKGHINVAIDFDAKLDGDGHAQVVFGMVFAGRMHDGAPPAPERTGLGDKISDPITFTAVADEDEIKAAGDYMADNFPGRRDMVGHLFRSPAKRYLMLVEFVTDAGDNELYFDVTRWVVATEAPWAN